jgi:hypothetical protein
MSGRQSLLAEIEAKRRAAAKKDEVEVLAADLSIAPEEASYDPYDKPGHAKPLDIDPELTFRRKALKKKRG